MTSTFSIPPLSCIWRGCQKRNWQKKSRAAGRRSSKCRSTLNRPPISSSAWGSEIADKSLAARRAFSLDGLKELDALYEQLLSNLKLAMSVFFSGDVTSARRLRRSKHRFRILNRRYSHAHVDRLHQQNVQSIGNQFATFRLTGRYAASELAVLFGGLQCAGTAG